MKPIIGPYDERARIQITLPYDSDGRPAFTDKGKPVPGVTAVTFSLPRWDFMPRREFRAMMAAIEAIEAEATDEDTAATRQDRSYAMTLATLEPYVTPEVLDLLSDMPMAVLEQISTDWNEGSAIPLGKLRTSTNSSRTIKAPSTTTSSDSDTGSET